VELSGAPRGTLLIGAFLRKGTLAVESTLSDSLLTLQLASSATRSPEILLLAVRRGGIC
jgi:hypothetical protein